MLLEDKSNSTSEPGADDKPTAIFDEDCRESEEELVRRFCEELDRKGLTRDERAAATESWLLQVAQQHRGQMRLAYEFAARNLGRIMHVTGVGWYAYDGKRWINEGGEKWASNAVAKTVRTLWKDAIGDKELIADLNKCQSASGVAGVLKLASSLPGITCEVAQLDADPYLFNTQSGTLDLRTKEQRPHHPGDRITKICNASYDANASSELLDGFLEQVLPNPEVRGYLQRFFGLALVGEVIEHNFTILNGTGRNGKSVCYGAVVHMFGEYADTPPPSLFEQVKQNPNAPAPEFFDLMGVRLIVLSETRKTARIDAALVKRLTGGDRLKARALYEKKGVSFDPSHSVALVTNKLPALPSPEDDPAVWARMKVVDWPVVVPKEDQDPHLLNKLKAEADAILAWAVQGFADYEANGGLNPPSAVEQATNSYAEAQNNVRRFLDEMCTDDPPNGGDTTTILHNAYTDWCGQEGIFREHRLGRTEFGKALDKMGFQSRKTKRGMVRYLGVAYGGVASSPIQYTSPDDDDDYEPPQELTDDELEELVMLADDEKIEVWLAQQDREESQYDDYIEELERQRREREREVDGIIKATAQYYEETSATVVGANSGRPDELEYDGAMRW